MIWPYLMSFIVTWLYTTPRKKNTSMTCLKPSLKPYTMLWRPSTNIISKWLLRTQKVFPVITNIFLSRSGLGRIHSSSSQWGGKWYFPGSPATALQRRSHTSRAAIWCGKRQTIGGCIARCDQKNCLSEHHLTKILVRNSFYDGSDMNLLNGMLVPIFSMWKIEKTIRETNYI